MDPPRVQDVPDALHVPGPGLAVEEAVQARLFLQADSHMWFTIDIALSLFKTIHVKTCNSLDM